MRYSDSGTQLLDYPPEANRASSERETRRGEKGPVTSSASDVPRIEPESPSSESVSVPGFGDVATGETDMVNVRYEGLAEHIKTSHRVAGELFDMHIESGTITLSHRGWSLLGCGASLIEAEQDLLRCANAIWPAYKDLSVPMTPEAFEMRDFMLRVIDGTS